MSRLGSAIRLMFCMPPVWIATAELVWVGWLNGREPLVDIALYAIQRLFQ